MRISLRDHHNVEVDFATVDDVRDAPSEAMLLLARLGCVHPGSLLVFDDDRPRREPGMPMTLTVGHVRSLAGRLEHRANAIDPAQPLSAEDLREDLRTAARFCRHALRVGWFKTSVTVA